MYLIFCLFKKDILSLGDLIIVKALNDLYGTKDKKILRSIRGELLEFGTIASVNL